MGGPSERMVIVRSLQSQARSSPRIGQRESLVKYVESQFVERAGPILHRLPWLPPSASSTIISF